VETETSVPPPPAHLDLEELLTQRPRLAALARRLLADEHGAEDVVQEAWVAALERPPRDERAIGAWMRSVVRTLALRRRRGERRSRAREERVARPEVSFEGATVADRLRTQREVVDAVLGLDEPLRGTVHARYFEDLPPREIARRQGVSIDTVNDRLKRARRKLRADLGRRLADGGRVAWSLALLPLAELSPRAAALLELHLAGGVAAAATATGATAAAGSTPTLPTFLGELLVMKKILAAALVLAAAGGGLWWARVQSAPSTPSVDPTVERPLEGSVTATDPEPPLEVREDPSGARRTAPEDERAKAAAAADWIVRGRVFFGPSTPAPATQVQARLWSSYDTNAPALLEATLTSDAEGRIEWLLDVPVETVTLRWSPVLADAVGYGDGGVVPLGEAPPQQLEVRVYPLDATVTGTVRDERGAAVAGALVRASTEGTTDADGRYTVRASSFRAQEFVHARASGLAQMRASVETPAPGGEVECDFTLRPAFRIAGRVLDESRMPVAGAEVATFFGAGNSATSDAHGEFVLDHLDPGHDRHSVKVKADGYVELSETIETGSGEPVERDFVLERGARLAGRVLDGRGRGIAAAQVCLGFSTSAWNAQWSPTRDDGTFEFPCAPRGEQALWVQRAGHAARKHVVQVPESGDPEEVTIVLEAGRAVSGRVVDGEGRGVPAVSVRPCYAGDLLDLSVKTDADGAFALEHVPDAEVEMSFYRKNWDRVDEDLAPGDIRDLVVVMNPSGRVAGRVIDASTGKAVETFRVRLERVRSEPGAHRVSLSSTWVREGRTFSDAEGLWETTDLELPAGQGIAVEVRAEGYASSGFVRATIAADPDPDDLVIALTRGLRVRGRVVDAGTGVPVAGARVSYQPDPTKDMELLAGIAFSDAWTGYFTRTDAAGDFTFENVAPQKVTFEVEHDDYERNSRSGPHEISEHGPEPSFLIELGGAGGITGVALDAGGAPRAGVELLLIGFEVRGVAGEIQRTGTTGGDGRFAFSNLPEGYYRLGEAVPVLQGDLGIGRGLGVVLRGVPSADVVLRAGGSASIRGTLVGRDPTPQEVELKLMILPRTPPSAPPFTHPMFTVVARGGSFELEDLPPGTYTVESRWLEDGRPFLGHPFQVELQAGAALQGEFTLLAR